MSRRFYNERSNLNIRHSIGTSSAFIDLSLLRIASFNHDIPTGNCMLFSGSPVKSLLEAESKQWLLAGRRPSLPANMHGE